MLKKKKNSYCSRALYMWPTNYVFTISYVPPIVSISLLTSVILFDNTLYNNWIIFEFLLFNPALPYLFRLMIWYTC